MKTITVSEPKATDAATLLENVAHRAFAFFWNESHPATGLTKDRAVNKPGKADTYTVASIASTGYALAAYPIGVENGWVTRKDAEVRALLTLRFVRDKLPEVHGFHYHFITDSTGAREWKCELSSIDTALLLKGVLAAGQYFGGEAKQIAETIYARTDWQWMQNRQSGDKSDLPITMGWHPEKGFIDGRWGRYDESSYLYILALGAPKYALPAETWQNWRVGDVDVQGFKTFGQPSDKPTEPVSPGAIFWAQMTPAFFNLSGMIDSQKRDYWTAWMNAHKGNHAYCAANRAKFKTYGDGFWGITACDQPPPVGYGAQEPTDEHNDGTVAPTAMLASIIFTPELAQQAVTALYTKERTNIWGRYGFANAFNLDRNWYDADVIGIDLGMMLLALENRRSGLLWKLTAANPHLQSGLKRMGFRRA